MAFYGLSLSALVGFAAGPEIGVTGNFSRQHRYADLTPFSIAFFGDTQTLVNNTGGEVQLQEAVDWVVANAAAENIELVVALGDLVNDPNVGGDPPGDPNEWSRFSVAWKTFDTAGLPHVVVKGNHDNDFGFDANFGAAYLDALAWSDPNSVSVGHSHAYTPTLGGKRMLVLSLPWNADVSEKTALRDAVDDNPGLPVIMLSHAITNPLIGTHPGDYPIPCDFNSCRAWGEFITDPNMIDTDRIVLTASGHFFGGPGNGHFKGIYSWVDGAQNVRPHLLTGKMLDTQADYQDVSRDNRIYLVRFDPLSGTVQVVTVDPNDGSFTESEGEASLAPVRWSWVQYLGPNVTVKPPAAPAAWSSP